MDNIINNNMDKLNKLLEKELAMFEKGIIATPKDRASLDNFAKANQGSADIILTQMAVQFGYVEALKSIKKELSV